MFNRQLSNKKINDTVGPISSNKDSFEKLKSYINSSNTYEYGGRINGRIDKLIINKSNTHLISKNSEKLKYKIGFSSVLNAIYGLLNKKKYLK
jgi:hypothetical protein